MTVKEALARAEKELKAANVLEPEASARVLLGAVLGLSRTELLANLSRELEKSEEKRFGQYMERRKQHESVWHILGYVYFWGIEYLVNEHVLVPRPETEILVEDVVNYILGLDRSKIQNTKFNILDVGTGSGTIAIALAAEFPELQITATDVSAEALKLAKKNAKRNGIKNIKFVEADLFEPVTKSQEPLTKYDIVTANLPYIPEEDMGTLAADVHHYEPKLALSGGVGGLEVYERFLRELPSHLEKGGACFCEIGINQGEPFKGIVKKYLPGAQVEIEGDLAGIDRVGIIRLKVKG